MFLRFLSLIIAKIPTNVAAKRGKKLKIAIHYVHHVAKIKNLREGSTRKLDQKLLSGIQEVNSNLCL